LAATLRLDGSELSVEDLSGRLDGGTIVEDGDPKVVLKDPQHERTKSFLTALDMA